MNKIVYIGVYNNWPPQFPFILWFFIPFMRFSSIVEVLLVFIGWRFGFYVLQFYTGLNTFGLLQFIIPALIITVTRRKWADYGFTTKQWQDSTEIGLNAYLLALIPIGAMLLLPLIGVGYQDILGGSILGAFYLVILLLLFQIIERRERARNIETSPITSVPATPQDEIRENADLTVKTSRSSQNSFGRKNLVIIAILLAFPILFSLVYHPQPSVQTEDVVYWDLWQFFVSGFGEETFYRGYIQSRINAEFGRPYTFKEVRFGPGLLNPFDPTFKFEQLCP